MKSAAVISVLVSFLSVMLVAAKDDYPWNTWPKPPPHTETAKMARYLTHYSTWGVLSAYSPEYQTPFGTVQSFSDGPQDKSTGVPYLFISDWSDSYKNIAYNNSATLTFSMAEGQICRTIGEDPEQPPCARLMLVGKVLRVTDAEEQAFAKKALYTKHPAMKDWPTGHTWRFFKLKPTAVHLQDFYGPAARVPLKDYFSATPDTAQANNTYS